MSRREYDYSQYEHSEYERYVAQWRGGNGVTLSFFNNHVYFDTYEKCFTVIVDDNNEHPHIDKLFEELEGALAEEDRERAYNVTSLDPEKQKKEIAQVLGRYQGVFSIEKDEDSPAFDYTESRLNCFSGMKITVPLGEGILNFCYADFEEAFEKVKPLYFMFSEEFSRALTEGNCAPNDNEAPCGETQELIRSRTEEVIRIFEQYTNTISVLCDVFYCSLYTAIFPPVFLQQSESALAYYTNYLNLLQSEFLELIEFCFDESFYPEVLGNLNPAERYSLYCHIRKRPSSSMRTEVFFTSLRMTGDRMPYGMPYDELVQKLEKEVTLTEEQKAFAERYRLDPGYLEFRYQFPLFISTAYECSTVRDMLYLEFTKILEQNIKLKKCKRCGRYFIMKGNYPGDYCDRMAGGETRSCQQLAAQDNYKAKLKDNGAWGAYSKYYKRYFARMKVGTIKPPAFKQWQYAAVARRDECSEGKLPLEEYVAWLEGSFPNRKNQG